MGKKGNKRPLEGTEASVKPVLNEKQPGKKLKVTKEAVSNGLSQKIGKNPKKPMKNGVQEPKIINNAKLETKKAIKVKNQEAKVKKENVKIKKENEEVKKENGNVKKMASKEISVKKLEELKKKKELRKEMRLKKGQYKPENIQLNEEQVVARINEIESRGAPTKTAKRKLATLKKKLKILQGTYVEPVPVKKMSESTKRKIRRHKNAVMRAEKLKNLEGDGNDRLKSVEAKAKRVAALVKEERSKKEVKGAKKLVKVEAEAEDDDDDDEEDEDDSEEDEELDNSNLNSSGDTASPDDDDDEEEDEEEEDEEEEDEDDEDEEIDNSNLNSSADTASLDDDDDDDDDDEEEEVKPPQPPPKKLQKSTINPEKKESAQEKKTRYVLFIGNLSFTASPEDIKKHFLTKVSEVCSVRIPKDPKTDKPRGFAYVEFTNNVDYEKALSLHQSEFQGRRIKVQYSAAGSKNSGKKPDVVAKNQKLHALRKQGKLAGSIKDSNKRNFRRNKQNRQGV